jgi:hypothetical protein
MLEVWSLERMGYGAVKHEDYRLGARSFLKYIGALYLKD